MKLQFLQAGEIVTCHGVHGEVKVLPWADGPDFLLDFKRIRMDGKEYKVVIDEFIFLVELDFLKGAERLEKIAPVKSLIHL